MNDAQERLIGTAVVNKIKSSRRKELLLLLLFIVRSLIYTG